MPTAPVTPVCPPPTKKVPLLGPNPCTRPGVLGAAGRGRPPRARCEASELQVALSRQADVSAAYAGAMAALEAAAGRQAELAATAEELRAQAKRAQVGQGRRQAGRQGGQEGSGRPNGRRCTCKRRAAVLGAARGPAGGVRVAARLVAPHPIPQPRAPRPHSTHSVDCLWHGPEGANWLQHHMKLQCRHQLAASARADTAPGGRPRGCRPRGSEPKRRGGAGRRGRGREHGPLPGVDACNGINC